MNVAVWNWILYLHAELRMFLTQIDILNVLHYVQFLSLILDVVASASWLCKLTVCSGHDEN